VNSKLFSLDVGSDTIQVAISDHGHRLLRHVNLLSCVLQT